MECVYCDNPRAKIWKDTNEPVCLSCRIGFLSDEFYGIEIAENIIQAKYYADLLRTEREPLTNFSMVEGGEL